MGAKLKLSGEIEVDESYFVAKRVRGKCGRAALCKTPVFSFAPAGWSAKTRWQGLYWGSEQLLSKDLTTDIRVFSDLENSTIFSDSLTMGL